MSETEEPPVRALLCVCGQRDTAVGQLCWHEMGNKCLQQRDELKVNIDMCTTRQQDDLE